MARLGFWEYEGKNDTRNVIESWGILAKIVGEQDVIETATGNVVGKILLVHCPKFVGRNISNELEKLYGWEETEDVNIKVFTDGTCKILD